MALCSKAVVATLVILWCTAASSEGFEFENVSPYKPSHLNMKKFFELRVAAWDNWDSIIYDYCLRNGKTMAREASSLAHQETDVDVPFAARFYHHERAELILNENNLRNRLAHDYNYTNVYKLFPSNFLENIAFFMANLQVCFPVADIDYKNYWEDPRKAVFYMYKHPKRYGLLKDVNWDEVPNVVSLKVAIFEDFYFFNTLKNWTHPTDPEYEPPPVRTHVSYNWRKGFHGGMIPAIMYFNGLYNFTKDPRKPSDEGNYTWDGKMLHDENVLKKHSGSLFVGYAFNGYKVHQSHKENGLEIMNVLRIQLVAVYAYIFWDTNKGTIDEDYLGSSNRSCGDYYMKKGKGYGLQFLKMHGIIEGFDEDATFPNLCVAKYKQPDVDYGNFAIGYMDDDESECCYACVAEIVLSLVLATITPLPYRLLKTEENALNKYAKKAKRKIKLKKSRNKGGAK